MGLNVFEDLELVNADELFLKADLAFILHFNIVEEHNLRWKDVGKVLKLSKKERKRLKKNPIHYFSVYRLAKFIAQLTDSDVNLTVLSEDDWEEHCVSVNGVLMES